jgi:Flp pilus assembly protein TadG
MTGRRADSIGPNERERGIVGLDWLIVLPLVIGVVLVMVALPKWPERQSGARAAAAEAARSAVLAERPDQVDAIARSVATEVLSNYNVPADAYSVQVDGELERGTRITVTVAMKLPVIKVPFGPDLAARTFVASATEDVESYREIER